MENLAETCLKLKDLLAQTGPEDAITAVRGAVEAMYSAGGAKIEKVKYDHDDEEYILRVRRPDLEDDVPSIVYRRPKLVIIRIPCNGSELVIDCDKDHYDSVVGPMDFSGFDRVRICGSCVTAFGKFTGDHTTVFFQPDRPYIHNLVTNGIDLQIWESIFYIRGNENNFGYKTNLKKQIDAKNVGGNIRIEGTPPKIFLGDVVKGNWTVPEGTAFGVPEGRNREQFMRGMNIVRR